MIRIAGVTVLAVLFVAATLGTVSAKPDNIGLGRSAEVVGRIGPRLAEQARERGVELGAPVFMRIFKKERELEIWLEGNDGQFGLFKTYRICRLSGTLGPKVERGDRQAPEGFYFVTANRLNPWSRFHLSFDLGYPNAYDRIHGRTGGNLMVHGNCVSVGCYAMTDGAIEEIYTLAEAALAGGQRFFRVHVFPFRMTEQIMTRFTSSPWIGFWKNLKEGYDLFETQRRPPEVGVRGGRYTFVPAFP